MAKYELLKTTDVNGEVWYSINKDGIHVNSSFSKELKVTEEMLTELLNGRPSQPIIEILKTIENADN